MNATVLVAAVTKTATAAAKTTTASTAAAGGSAPSLSPAAPPGSAGFLTIISWIGWAATAICVIGVVIAAGRMALSHRRGEGGEHVQGLGMVLIACVLIGSASALVDALT